MQNMVLFAKSIRFDYILENSYRNTYKDVNETVQ